MASRDHRWAGRAEIGLVLAMGFGPQLWQSGLILYRQTVLHRPLPQAWLTDRALLLLAAFELAALALISLVGLARGWSIKSFGWRMSWPLTGAGLLLFGCGLLAYRFLPLGLHFQGQVSLAVLLPVLAVDAFFEEALELGYVFRVFGRFGMWPAILAGAVLRSAIHLYAGWPAMLSIFAGAILYGLVYWRWKSLWPAFLGHLLADLLVLAPLVRR